MCSWATRSRLKRSLDLGASYISILDSGLDLVTAGSSFFPHHSQLLAVFFAVIQFLILSGHYSPRFLAVSDLAPVPPSAGLCQESLCLAPELLGPAKIWPGP